MSEGHSILFSCDVIDLYDNSRFLPFLLCFSCDPEMIIFIYLSCDIGYSCWANGCIFAYCSPFVLYGLLDATDRIAKLSYHSNWSGVPRSLFTMHGYFLECRRLNACIMTCGVGRRIAIESCQVKSSDSSLDIWCLLIISSFSRRLMHPRLYVWLYSTTAVHAIAARWTVIAFLCMF